MTKLCLRCDWQGTIPASVCPDCGAPLYVSGDEAPAPAARLRAGTPPAAAARVVPAAAGPSKRARPPLVLAAVTLVFAASLGAWLDAHRAPTAAPARRGRLAGTLVYAVPDGPYRSRLWRWDLATGDVVRGPRVARAVALVDASDAHAGWLGLTTQLPDGRLRGSILRSLGPGARARPVLTGDLLAWGPGGDSLVVARRGRLAPGCRRRVAIVWAGVVPAFRERRYADDALCGDVLSVGLGDVSTYFTLDRGGRTGVFLAGFRRIHRLLEGRALVAVSAVDDMLVVPAAALGGVPLPGSPEQPGPELPETGLYFQGSPPSTVTPYGVGTERFAIDRVLAWSPDALTALVTGRLGGRNGVFELDTGPAAGERAPRYIGPAAGFTAATFAADGTAILETRDGLFAVADGGLVPIEPPFEAPAPLGPIVWTR